MHEKAHQQCSISGTSSLFRMGYATMIDSTKKGSIARSIYHCCMYVGRFSFSFMSKCTAELMVVCKQKEIVIYAIQVIDPNEEITYN
ncbi:hypothetical protein HMPREF1544_00404 [Mucor circinelloides 1006PhL]|uniref:SET domain-containing protein n=1 Tax=Mucor circinelloides f. circinelloides (strain 1006PhL) TaxID=1220926 RepID=S2KJT0_MUCC1|nr:hypothetical protein HMPREF1544_12345 [Mucor circinelloides 1006PhL]EPB92675.1 hypothetical protein HMPREF1544_00404 [Mucor circinelloides 1006PhL]